jgi:arsenate reductase-like glutaredoxin family protein
MQKKQVTAERLHLKECPFTPRLARKSIELANSSGREFQYKKREPSPEVHEAKPLKKLSQRELQEFIRRTEEKYNKLNEKLTQKRQAKSEEQANSCTFKPSLTATPREFSRRQISLYELAVQKQERLKRLRDESALLQSEAEVSECTFKPQIIKSYPVPAPESEQQSGLNYLRKFMLKLGTQ